MRTSYLVRLEGQNTLLAASNGIRHAEDNIRESRSGPLSGNGHVMMFFALELGFTKRHGLREGVWALLEGEMRER